MKLKEDSRYVALHVMERLLAGHPRVYTKNEPGGIDC